VVSLCFVVDLDAIQASHRLSPTFLHDTNWNPDNIAPPIAACLGDLVTLCLVGVVSAALINLVNTPFPFILVLLVILSSFSCALITHRNPFVKDLIKQGWSPLFGAMIISSATGIVLDIFASRYEGFPLLAIVISGLFPLCNLEMFLS